MNKALALGVLGALVLAPRADAQTMVLPDGYASTEGSGSSSYPWNRTTGGIRIMYCYDSTNVSNQWASGPIRITKLRWRANGSTATWGGGTFSNVTIDLSTSTTDWQNCSMTFDTNHGTDRTRVYSGTVTVKPSPAGGGTTPQNDWYVEVDLTQGFLYDPSSGDLLIDFVIPVGSFTGTSTFIDLGFGAASTPPVLGSRFWNLDPTQATASLGAPQLNSLQVVEITWTPPNGLFPSFNATPTTGGPNLQVTFTDTTFSSRPGGVLSRTWDFGDGTTGTGATVTHTYTCGTFSPKLTVIDAQETKSITRTDLIEAGLVTADFTGTPTFGTAPLAVTFTDASTGGATGWTWDFGDGNTSTAQNPTHTYTTDGTFSVKLTAQGRCNSDTLTITNMVYIRAQGTRCLDTIFTGGNGLTANDSGNMFDVDVKNPKGVKINGLDVSDRVAAGTQVAVDVYITPSTYVGKDTAAEQWVLVSSGTGLSTGTAAGTRTPIGLTPFLLPQGKWGMYIVQKTGGIHYTNGNGTNQSYSNADMDLTLGISKSALFGGSTFRPRVWNGSLCYAPDDDAANGPIGYGCPGTNSEVPVMTFGSEPKVGTTVNITVSNMLNTPAGIAWLFLGAASSTGFDLTPLGAPGCALFATPTLFTAGSVNLGGSVTIPGPIPNNTSLIGGVAAIQHANVDAGSPNPLKVASTPGHALRIGN